MAQEPIQLPVIRGKSRETAEKAKEYHQMRVDAIDEQCGALLQGAQRACDEADFEFETLRAKLNRLPLYWKPPWASLYLPFLVLLAIAEIPVNRLSFQLFFNDGPVMSLAVAGLVGAILIALCHVAGVSARRFRHACAEPGGGWSALARLFVLVSIISALCYGVAVFRQGYLSFVTTPDPSFAALIADDQYGEAAVIALRAGLGIDGVIFLIINLAIVCVGMFFAFSRHDPHPNFEQLDIDRATTRKAYAKIEKRRGEELAAEERRYESERRRRGW